MCIICYTINMNLLNNLTNEEKKLIKKLSFKKGNIIAHELERCEAMYIIEEGNVKIVSYSINGNEKIISTHQKNDVFANALIFSKSPYFLGNIICLTDATIYQIDKYDLLHLLQTNELFLINYINLLSEKTINLNIKNKLLSNKNIRERILYYFEINQYKLKKNIALISRELILPRPSVSREIHKMINENLIIIENNYLLLKK